MSDKVYCEECAYFRDWKRTYVHRDECHHPENIVQKEARENYRRRGYIYSAPDKEPSKLNEFNNCPWWKVLPEEPQA